jgi:hypothetical protein
MRALLIAIGTAFTAIVGGVIGLAMLATGLSPNPPSAGASMTGPVEGIPAGLEAVYQDAASRYCDGLPWEVLAGIGWMESRHGSGRLDPATGMVDPPVIGPAIDGRPGFAAIPDPTSTDGWAHALGPMQFLSTTWRRWATLAPGRPAVAAPSPHNMWDAIHAAARMLCGNRPVIDDIRRAVFGYNRSWDYVDAVLARGERYRTAAATSGTPATG